MPDAMPLEQIEAIYRSAPIGLCVLDRELRYVRVNDLLARINGLPPAAHLGRRVGELLPEIADVLEPILRRVLDGETIHNVEIATQAAPGGSGRTVVMHCVPLSGPGSAVAGINVVVEDVTEAKNTAARLKSAERRLWLQTEHSPIAVIEWDAGYRVTRWGGAAEAIFGWQAEAVLGVHIEALHIVVEEDWPVVQRTMARLSAAGAPHVVSSHRNYTRDGRTISCDWYNSVLRDPDGGLESVLSLVADVTEQRRVQAEQELLAAASEVLAAGTATDAAIERLVRLPIPAFADWCGLESLTSNEIRPRSFAHRDAKVEAELGPLHRRLPFDWGSVAPTVEVLRTGRSLLLEDCRSLPEDAIDERHVALLRALAPTSLLSVPLRVEERIIGVWNWGRSRSERFTHRDLRLAEELARRTATAILNAELFEAVGRANRTKDQFLATLGHELRQPLSALTAAMSLLAVTASSDKSERIWQVTSRQLKLMNRLVDDMLDLSRIERGKLLLDRAPLDLRDVVREAIESTAHVVRERAQHVHVATPECRLPIRGDAARLQQVVSNLLTNASKFSADGGTIEVSLRQSDECARLSVRDSGRGVPPAELHTIFEPFAQTHPGGSGGLGIGLAVVQQLVRLHGGTVEAHSEGEGTGCEFVVTIPLVPEAVTTASRRMDTGSGATG
jgi:PAS domain S-box-containing protein